MKVDKTGKIQIYELGGLSKALIAETGDFIRLNVVDPSAEDGLRAFDITRIERDKKVFLRINCGWGTFVVSPNSSNSIDLGVK